MRGDGDGWVQSHGGTWHWGRHGAAGLLLRAPLADGTPAVLMQHRAPWSHQGGTWGLPGGAIDSDESAQDAALREAWEEARLPGELLAVRTEVLTAQVHGPGGAYWSYTTVIADAVEPLPTVANGESSELRWVAEHRVADLPLHPAFAESWAWLRVSPSAPPHACELRPHTVTFGATIEQRKFAWCAAGAAPA